MKDKGVSGKDLADAMEVTPASISNIVQGNSFPKPELLLNIARFLDIDIRDLFHPTKQEDNPFNGFVEHKGHVHKIQSIGDIENLLKEAK